MGTNYYLKRIPTKEEIEKTKRLLDEGRIESLSSRFGWDPEKDCAVQDMIDRMTESIHIGRFADGWRFTFRAHDHLHERSYAAIFDFIELSLGTGRWKLIDEYDGELTLNEFKGKVEKSKEGLTFETDPNNASYLRYIKKTDSISEDGSWWSDSNFC